MQKENRENIRKELQDLGSSLPEWGKQPGFELSQDYFQTFPQRMQQRINQKPQAGLNWLRKPAMVRLVPALAAILLLVVITIHFFRNNSQDFLTEASEMHYEEYFAFVSEYDRALFLEIVTQDGIFTGQAATDEQSEMIIDYMVDMAEYYGLNYEDFIEDID
jgi:hypothetical protein